MEFEAVGFRWAIREGFPPMGSQEESPPFIEALRSAHRPLTKFTIHETTSWIVARLQYVTGSTLSQDGDEFAHDTDDFGYKLRLQNLSGERLAHGAIIFREKDIRFESVSFGVPALQPHFLELLLEWPDDLGKCRIVVREPESRKRRTYGWDGYSLYR